MLHGMVLRPKPRPVGFNSAVQRSRSTLDITKAPLCPSATTRSPCFGMRFFRLAMPQFPTAQTRLLPRWISNFTGPRILNGFASVFGRESSHRRFTVTVGCHRCGQGQQPRTGRENRRPERLRTEDRNLSRCPMRGRRRAQISSQEDDWALN